MKTRRVVITGMGAATPLGLDVASTWQGLCDGRSGVGPITIFDASTFPTRIAGEVKRFDFDKWKRRKKGFESLGRNSFFALEASEQALKDAGIRTGEVPFAERFGIYFGAGDGGFDLEEYAPIVFAALSADGYSVDIGRYLQERVRRTNAAVMAEEEPYCAVNHLADVFGLRGPVYNTLTACAASSQAIGEAVCMIRNDQADLMLTGGSHSMIHPMGLAGFNLLTAITTSNDSPREASRPFDKNRDGFVLSEGAGAIVLEELEHAKARGAAIYAELIGYGATADAYRMTDPHPAGRGAIAAVQSALRDAALGPDAIDYINAHGTSTQLNDQVETAAIKAVFGERAKKIPVSSIKSMLGHMIAAAGVVELIASALTIREGIIPPTINYRTPDEACDLDYVPNTARRQKVSTVLSNSFGFGGQNIALIAKAYEK